MTDACAPARNTVRHITTWHRSTTAMVTLPAVGVLTLWAAIVCGPAHKYGVKLVVPLAPLTLISSALALLLTLKTNQSLVRLLETRLALGRLVLHARVVAGLLATRVSPVNPEAALLCGRLLCVVGWSLR